MSKNILVALVLSAMVVGMQPAFSLGAKYGKADPSWSLPKGDVLLQPFISPSGEGPARNPRWPTGVEAMVNGENRVGGFWVNANDFFNFEGNTNSFNDFLTRYSQLQNTPLVLVLHAGKAPLGPLSDKGDAVADWQLAIVNNDWSPARVGNDAGAAKDKVTPHEYTVTVDLWLGGQVELKGLKVPQKVKVISGGEIENFLARRGK